MFGHGSTAVLLPLTMAAAAAAALCAPAQAQSASRRQDRSVDSASVLDGVFTEAQATRGESVFTEVCAMCHGLREFTAGSHKPTAKFDNVGDMFQRIWSQMPMDDPGGLSIDEYIAVVSYILEQNGYPAGEQELPADLRELQRIRIEPIPADGQGRPPRP